MTSTPPQLDINWMQRELIPMLDLIYNVATGHDSKTYDEWESLVDRAAHSTETIPDYDDSIINIDRIRMVLNHSPHADVEDHAQAREVIDNQELIILVLVRHCITHGPYPLRSLGVGKNEQATQEREVLRQRSEKLPDMVIGKATADNRGGNSGRHDGNNSSNSDEALQAQDETDRFMSRPPSIFHRAASSAGSAGSADVPTDVDRNRDDEPLTFARMPIRPSNYNSLLTLGLTGSFRAQTEHEGQLDEPESGP